MKRYALVGTGGRGYHMFARAIVDRYADVAQLVGLCDVNPKRCTWVRDQLSPDIPVFQDFEAMVNDTQPDTVIIATVDEFHAEYIRKAFALGCDVICEKPLTTTAEMCNDIMDAEQEFGRKVVVTFNCRFMPYFARIKSMLAEGMVGDVLHVDFEWMLDTSHGADYFRRWHRQLRHSGGLLVHKSSHHFDIVNWLLEQDPVTVSANGNLMFYGQTRENTGERCLTCMHNHCEFRYRDAQIPYIKHMYFETEDCDGYYRDRCVFSKDIDIYDNMSLSVRYSKDTLLTYSLIAYSPYEGWRMTISGTNGRLEAAQYSSGPFNDDNIEHVCLYNRHGERVQFDMPKGKGTHGGGDEKLLNMLLRGGIEDPLGQFAGTRDGVMSAMIGIAANTSIKQGRTVTVNELLGRDI